MSADRPAVRLLVVAVLAASSSGCAVAGAATPGLIAPSRVAAVVDSVVASPALAATSWGIAVWDGGTGRWLVSLNAGKHFIPASNTKLVVTAVAMAELGADYRWETPVFARMQPGDTVAAELLIVGRGDPTFSARFHADEFTVTDSLADRIAAAGIRRIAGDIAVDVTFFGDRPVNGTWEVGDLPWYYAPPIEAFAIAEGTFGVVMHGDTTAGTAARIGPVGAPGLQPLFAHAMTDTAGARARLDAEYTDRVDAVSIRGRVGAGDTDTTRLAVTRPARYAARSLEWALRARGVRVDGRIRVLRDSAEAAAIREELFASWQRVAIMVSPPLSEVVAAILRPSQNWIAEHMLKTLGAERRGSGGWSTGLDVERRYLIDVAGVDSTGFFLRDGSGLSPQNLLTPRAVVSLLEHTRTRPWGNTYREALPEPGMEGSTLANRLLPLAGRLHAKTGSLTNVNALSGFVTTADGRVLTFSILTNGSGVPAAVVRRGIDRIVEAIAEETDRI